MMEWLDTIIFAGVYFILIRGARYYQRQYKEILADWSLLRQQHETLMYRFNQVMIQHYNAKPEEIITMQFNLPEK